MGFAYQVCYVIEARPELAARLRDLVEPDFAGLLLAEPVMYSRQESTDSTWEESERLLPVKLFFLASLREYAPLADDAAFTRVLGSPHISASLFDRWWTARRFEVDRELESDAIEAELRPYLNSVEATGSPRIDGWLAALRGAG
jgi:hypothetical protein